LARAGFEPDLVLLNQMLAGIERRQGYRGGMPVRYRMEAEGLLPESYAEIASIMKVHRASVQ
jgi:hypothetical protein